MSCACNNKDDGRLTSPYDYCPRCVEKHMSTVVSMAVPGSAVDYQAMIGELKLSMLHSDGNHELYSMISRIDVRTDGVDSVRDSALSVLDVLKSLSDEGLPKGAVKEGNYGVEYKDDVTSSEDEVCIAWRLYCECGYERVNRPVIIDRLLKSQIMSYRSFPYIASKIRDIRHKVQDRVDVTPDEWRDVLNDFKDAIGE